MGQSWGHAARVGSGVFDSTDPADGLDGQLDRLHGLAAQAGHRKVAAMFLDHLKATNPEA